MSHAVYPHDEYEDRPLGHLLRFVRCIEQDQRVLQHPGRAHPPRFAASAAATEEARSPRTPAISDSKSMPAPAFPTVLPVREVMTSPAKAAVIPQKTKVDGLIRLVRLPDSTPAAGSGR